ncbi:GT4 family glycosyltransferase PelF [Paracoccus sp. TK19116]|uniref:GT4 family glycosyltransferase PelF n=1 Tax=Paracoccus albicereus TaxID=2922394 RepID=A0ABT1MSZ1_9RHOB|nr:GT4 family glycosyltransferase PelF [Paracoccus albicereus]MCQ0971427.1 GT4 family glycosyltransferase PelF [Paracoccus albicereus]
MDDWSPVDVCIVVEGCYPFVAGGVSSWLDWLIRSQPDTSFGIVAIVADERPREIRYELPPNVVALQVLPLAPKVKKPGLRSPDLDGARFAELMYGVLRKGDPTDFDELLDFVREPVSRRPFGFFDVPRPPEYGDLTASPAAWQAITECYRRIAPEAAFSDFFWAWRNLAGSLLAVVTAPIAPARTYHAISTGYAGLYAVRAARLNDRTVAITEHGIYTNERRIDLIMADWISDSIDIGLAGADSRTDVRRFWIDTFETFARIAYHGCTKITTLYGANQAFQRTLGADESKLQVIPNGIALEKFDAIRPSKGRRPTVALIGRVVPIKDIEACIAAAAIVKRAIPEVEVLIIGPTDEDEDYFALCKRRVIELGLFDTVKFTGKVNIVDYLPRIDVLILTSISEAQPLVLLEAGAARIPCVATDVGSCREIIEGAPDEIPNLGPAGRVAPPMDAEAIGQAITELMADPVLRAACGETLRKRVETYFTSEISAARYAALYRELVA